MQSLQARIHQLESENKRLRGEIECHQDERKNYQQVMTKMQLQLVQHKDNMANMEQLFHAQQQEQAKLEQANRLQRTQFEDVQQQLRKANQQLGHTVTDNEKLSDDILAKTQQVKQYKKQVDGLKAEVAAKHEVSYMYTIISIQMCWHGKHALLEVGIRLQCYWTHCTVHSTFGVLSCSVLELQQFANWLSQFKGNSLLCVQLFIQW